MRVNFGSMGCGECGEHGGWGAREMGRAGAREQGSKGAREHRKQITHRVILIK